MAEYDEIFDYNYSTHMTKMTMAAIPDFKYGAMENWGDLKFKKLIIKTKNQNWVRIILLPPKLAGLLTYREMFLIFDPKQSTAKDQQEVAKTVAHEASHMWFGKIAKTYWKEKKLLFSEKLIFFRQSGDMWLVE